jgi:hypothetical protein
MTPKEKAKELVYKYEYLVTTWDCYNDEPVKEKYKLPNMKKCALIAVDEMIQQFTNKCCESANIRYWQEVKQEIQVL